jgi:hypothetical protein
MKFLVVTSLKEYRSDVFKIFKKAGITVYSTTEVTGIKEDQSPDLMEEWFAAGNENYDSVIIFSFTQAEKAKYATTLIENYNQEQNNGFPLRAFVIPVEESIC